MINITGIFIRKMLLLWKLRPSDFDEKAIYDYCVDNSIDDWEFAGEFSNGRIERFRVH